MDRIKLSADREYFLGENNTFKVEKGDESAVLFYDNKVRVLKSSGIITIKDKDNRQIEIDTDCVINKPYDYKDTIVSCVLDRKDFLKIADISTINEVIKNGGQFYNEKGQAESVYLLLKKGGYNVIRLRLWNDPKGKDGVEYGGGNNDLEQDLSIAKVAYALGFDIMLDFHYSDFWADPASQRIPKEWESVKSSNELARKVEDFTYSTLKTFLDNGIFVRYVQVGNEITNGMMSQPSIKTKKNKLPFKISGGYYTFNFKKYIRAGIRGVRKLDKNIKTIIHIDRGADAKTSMKFYNRIRDIDYDIIALSYYPFFHGKLSELKKTLNAVSEFNKPIIVVETSYAFTDKPHENLESVFSGVDNKMKYYEISPQGQINMLCDITKSLLEVKNNLGLGIAYWEPCWLPVKNAGWSKPGTLASWSDQGVFDYDGMCLPSLYAFTLMEKNN